MTRIVSVLVASAAVVCACESGGRKAEMAAWGRVTEAGPAYAEKVIACLRASAPVRFPRSCYARGDEELNLRVVSYFEACFECASQERCKRVAGDNRKILVAETFRRYPPSERTPEMERLLREVGNDRYEFACK